MVLEELGNSLKASLNRLLTSITVDKKLIEQTIVDIRRALIQSDVNLQLANELADKIRKRAFEESTPKGMSKREHVIKIVYEELVNLLGKKFEPLNLNKKPFLILMAGLLGSGKTTSTVKLARYLQKQGKSVGIICADVYRPAALEQLQQLGKQINVQVYGEKGNKNPIEIIENGIKEFSKKDVIIIDTAGRHKQEEKLMKEIEEIGKKIKPDETILVIDATIGQQAKAQAEAFHKVVPIGSIMITKMDGTSKGGGALSACSVTGAKVRFIGTGEKIENLELYDPDRFVSRLLGLGDLQTLLEKVKEAEIKKESVEKIIEGKFTLQDFMEQIENIRKVGPLSQIVSMIPGFGAIKFPKDALEKQEEKMKIWKFIIQSMTKEERENPDIIDSSRIKRIAKGSGRKEEEVRELLNQYNQMKKMLKGFGGIKGLDRGQLKQLARQLGFNL
jgi:signal recognition particle subunit SRP54